VYENLQLVALLAGTDRFLALLDDAHELSVIVGTVGHPTGVGTEQLHLLEAFAVVLAEQLAAAAETLMFVVTMVVHLVQLQFHAHEVPFVTFLQ
jgi:hypothetical protein